MSDAKVMQSVANEDKKVKRCEYRHDWVKVNEGYTRAPDGYICRGCNYAPKRDTGSWHEAESIVHLREVLKPGETVYTVLRHVSRSGMSRGIDVYRMEGNSPVWITGYVGHAIGSPQSRKDWERSQGLRVGGCGMDMGFHVVNSLSYVIFPEYRCLGKDAEPRCPSSYHVNHRDTVQCEGLPTYCVYYKSVEGKVEKLPEVYQTREKAEERTAILGEDARLPDGDSVSCDYLHCWRSETVMLPDLDVEIPACDCEDCAVCGGHTICVKCRMCARCHEHKPGCPGCSNPVEVVKVPQGKAYTITHEDGTEVICPTCKGHGRYPNPDGPEKWDLVHKDGYALRHKWL